MDKKLTKWVLFLLIVAGGVFRFYNLNWGTPYFFHPDERNIASAVLNINFPNSLNPHFFAYGAFPIYLTSLMNRFIGLFLKSSLYDHFALAILVGRVFSAILSTALIPLVFILTKRILVVINGHQSNEAIFNNETILRKIDSLGLLAAFLAAFNPGLIQYAHFSTFEIFLTIEYLLIAIFAIGIVSTGKKGFYLLTGLLLGLATATKVNSLVFVPILFLTHWFFYKFQNKRYLFLGLFVFILTASLTSPFNFLDYPSFKSALNYESSVALGSLAVFYTQGFLKTTPILFQLKSVLPYLWGWLITVLGALGGLGMLGMIAKDKFQTTRAKILLVFIFIPAIYWLFNSFLFVQWIRYSVPLVPFVIIAAVVIFFKVRPRQLAGPHLLRIAFSGLLLLTIVPTFISGTAMFLTYFQPDTRVQAAQWLSQQNYPRSQSKPFVLSEVYDLGITPFNTYLDPNRIALFDFYSLDPDPRLQFNPKQTALDKKLKVEELSQLLEKSDYIVLPSPRIWRTRLRLPSEFPSGSSFYQKLFDGSLGFVKIADFKDKTCDKLLPARCFWLNDDWAEETYTVFDRPEVLIFQKTKQLPASDYYRIIYFNQPS